VVGFYDYRLVALSVVIAVLAAYPALDLGGRVTATRGRARVWWLGGGAVALGIGTWSMHYVAMLAFILPVRGHGVHADARHVPLFADGPGDPR